MNYRFILTYKPTDSETTATRTCFPLHSDDLSISIDREQDEWYYTRKLDGKLVFERGDYDWIMGCEFDGTFTLDIRESHDGGANYYDYFTGTFSRASLEIDEDNKQATLNGLKEGVENLIKNGAKEDYDLMKLIPDSEAKEVQGQVPPALALVDYRSTTIDKSDIFCGGAAIGNGYKNETDWSDTINVQSNAAWNFLGVYAEAKITVSNGQSEELGGRYCGHLQYGPITEAGQTITSIKGDYNQSYLANDNNCRITFQVGLVYPSNYIYVSLRVWNSDGNYVAGTSANIKENTTGYYSPDSIVLTDFGTNPAVDRVEITFHYIRATLLTQGTPLDLFITRKNILDTGDYYKRMAAFNNNDGGLVVEITSNTSEQPNGHRMVPGTDEYGGTPQYFAPPDETHDWIPLAEDNWNYASMWYTIQPSVANGLLNPAKFGSFTWTQCWTIGTCIKFLLQRITDDKVVFAETTAYSQFLYGNPNPVADHEPFQWLVTQKSNVMSPAATGAARCIVRLDWFLELLRNAFNCYYWFERRNDGRYDFRIEHVEYFRRGGTYTPNSQDNPPLDLTRLKPYRNFLRNGQPAKRYADKTNRYTFDLDNMVEKYTYSWQGDGGSDDFRGNPMYFRAGWIEKGSSEDHQVDNIFADLGWLMLNANTDTESSKNFDGLFIFGGYRPFDTSQWTENKPATAQHLSDPLFSALIITITAPENHTITLELYHTDTTITETIATYTGTGQIQTIFITFLQGQNNVIPQINFGAAYRSVTIHRIQTTSGNVFRVPNVDNLLRDDDSKLQNGVLAWPWLQVEYLHYDIPAAKWTYLKDDYTDNPNLVWETDGTIKMVKKQDLAVVPVPDASTEDDIIGIMGVRTGLGIGIIDSAKINLSSRNAEMTIIYDINPQNN